VGFSPTKVALSQGLGIALAFLATCVCGLKYQPQRKSQSKIFPIFSNLIASTIY
jgi:hypothetical protein